MLVGLLLSATIAHSQTGVLDPTFGSNGIARTSLPQQAIVAQHSCVQSDGKILVVGYTSDTANRICIARYNVNGSLDVTFGNNGLVIASPNGGNAIANDISLQADGKIVVVGREQELFVARYNSNGTPDNTFGNAGYVTTSVLNNATASALVIQPDGKIVVGGHGMNSMPDGTAFVLLRYNVNGTLDQTFGNSGVVVVDIATGSGLGALDILNTIKLQSDGKIIAAGVSGPNVAIARVAPNGIIDSSFGTAGIVTNNYASAGNSVFNDIALQPDGKIVAVGSAFDAHANVLIVKYDNTGKEDVAFGSNGVLISSLSQQNSYATSILLQGDGKIMIGGEAYINNSPQFALARYSNLGVWDATFGNNGIVITIVDNNNSSISDIEFHDGGIVAIGSNKLNANADFIIARYRLFPLGVSGANVFGDNVMVYPNPTNDYLNIKGLNNGISIKLYDVYGKLIVDNVATNEIYRLDMSKLSEGVYMLQLCTVDGNNKSVIKIAKH